LPHGRISHDRISISISLQIGGSASKQNREETLKLRDYEQAMRNVGASFFYVTNHFNRCDIPLRKMILRVRAQRKSGRRQQDYFELCIIRVQQV
jgi:hypothetical protein